MHICRHKSALVEYFKRRVARMGVCVFVCVVVLEARFIPILEDVDIVTGVDRRSNKTLGDWVSQLSR